VRELSSLPPTTAVLPRTVLVFPGRHGFNTTVLPGNAVRIRGRQARHSFALAGGMVKPVFEARP
jgi:hypothetical protein